MKAWERRISRSVRADMRRCRLWMRRMRQRRGGFIIVIGCSGVDHGLGRFTTIVRFTNAPRALRDALEINTEVEPCM